MEGFSTCYPSTDRLAFAEGLDYLVSVLPQTAQTEARSRDNTASASTSNPLAVLSSGPESLVTSPDPGTGAQGAENSSQDAGAQQQPNPQNAGNAVGQNVDVSI